MNQRLLSVSGVARFRLARHGLDKARDTDLVTICRDICGAQAQIMSAAYLQLWARNHALRREQINAALWHDRSLVKTSLMRQTVHLIPADEFSIYISALKNSRIMAVLRVMKRCHIEAEEAHALTGLIMEVVSAGPLRQSAIREFVRPRVSKRVRSWMEKVWSILRIPIAQGLLCYGPGEANQVTFIRTDQWLKKQPVMSDKTARAELLRRYLRAYGPATLRDFSHWSGMPANEVRPLREYLAEELCEVNSKKTSCLLLRTDLEQFKTEEENNSSIRLLPHFDPYLLAHREKDHLISSLHYKRVYRNQGWISPVLLAGGNIAGTWSQKVQGKGLELTVEPFRNLSRNFRASVGEEAESLSRFLNLKLQRIAFS